MKPINASIDKMTSNSSIGNLIDATIASSKSRLDELIGLWSFHSNKAEDYKDEMRDEFFARYPNVTQMEQNKPHLKETILYGGFPDDSVFFNYHKMSRPEERTENDIKKYNKIVRKVDYLFGKLRDEFFPEYSLKKRQLDNESNSAKRKDALIKAIEMRKNKLNSSPLQITNGESNNIDNKENISPSIGIKRVINLDSISDDESINDDDECGNSIADLCPPKKKHKTILNCFIPDSVNEVKPIMLSNENLIPYIQENIQRVIVPNVSFVSSIVLMNQYLLFLYIY